MNIGSNTSPAGWVECFRIFKGLVMIKQLRQRLLALQGTPKFEGNPGTLPLGVPAIDTVLGGGLVRGALHEIAALGEAHVPAAAGFALGLAALGGAKGVAWIAEDMALAESGAPHGAGVDDFGLAPERLVTVTAAYQRDLLWAMEEALRCRAVSVVVGEMRAGGIDGVAVRRLSLAAADSGALALLLRAIPPNDASTAATRWIVGAVPSVTAHGPGAPRFAAHLGRNRYGPVGSWILEWSDSDERFILATHAQPLAAPAFNRSHRQVA
jgi:protein ImuA